MNNLPPPYELAVAWESDYIPVNDSTDGFPVPRDVGNLCSSASSAGDPLPSTLHNSALQNLRLTPNSGHAFVDQPTSMNRQELQQHQQAVDRSGSSQPPVIRQPAQQTESDGRIGNNNKSIIIYQSIIVHRVCNHVISNLTDGKALLKYIKLTRNFPELGLRVQKSQHFRKFKISILMNLKVVIDALSYAEN